MNRIDFTFNGLKKRNEKALINFIMAGDPDLDATKEFAVEMAKRGADLIELGIPFSDPVAEGPVIQKANERALRNNIKLKQIMRLCREIRKETEVPLIFLLYYNIIFNIGADKFFRELKENGVDGVIIPDLPYEEKGEAAAEAKKYGIKVISMVAPTSKSRVEAICREAEGFLYVVSSLGVTGMRSSFKTDFKEFFRLIDAYCSIPKCLGFGISGEEHVKQLKEYADGLIIGSAIVKRIEESSTREEAVKSIGDFTERLKNALL